MRFPSPRTATRATLGAAVLVVLGVAGGMVMASAASAPPAPTVISGPANPATLTSAVFAFRDSQAKVSFQCSLDAAPYAGCTSPRSYTGLGDGTHMFRVAAQTTGSPLSAPAVYGWTVDASAPAISLAFPANNGLYIPGTWNGGCAAGPGVCGTASDVSGVSSVLVSVLQQSSGRYWNSTGFSASGEMFNAATGTSSWRYPLALPVPDGEYTIHVAAVDRLGNQTPSRGYATAQFGIDSDLPPAPTITSHPVNPTTETGAQFKFTDTEPGLTFRCRIDGGGFALCTSGVQYTSLAVGAHTFQVESVDTAGNVSPATSLIWTVTVSGTFPISGSITQTFYPGRTLPLNLVITNPFAFSMKVTGVTITVQHPTSRNGQTVAGCDGPTNMVVSHGFAGTVTLPASSTRSLQDLGILQSQWPQMTMPNLSVNQDACKSAAFTFAYSGTGTQ